MDSSDVSARHDAAPGFRTAIRRRCRGLAGVAYRASRCPGDSRATVSVSEFLLSEPDTIKRIATDEPDGTRVALQIRMPLSLHAGVRRRADGQRTSIYTYLEQLMRSDAAAVYRENFVAVRLPKYAAGCKTGSSRPAKGARTGMTLRVAPHLRQQTNQRAESLQLLANDYPEYLVSHDISAARSAAIEGTDLRETA